jgi:glycosyltransferase involved in cell wall biosynthesis
MKKPLKVLCLTTFPIEGPCSRHRVWQYVPHLRRQGLQVEVAPFVSSRYYRTFYQAGTSPGKVGRLLGFQFRRSRVIQKARRADVILVQREAAIFGPPLLEWLMANGLKKPVVFDFDDAVQFVSPKYGKAGKVVQLVKWPQKTSQIITWSRAVVAGNRHLECFARDLNPDVTMIPTVVDHERVQPRAEAKAADEPVVLGWIGSHSTATYLESLTPVLAEVAREHPFVLRAIGAGRPLDMPGVPLDEREWSLERELADLQSFDIGLYPMPDDRWARGKSGFKAVQYMAVGIPTVSSPVGATCDIVEDGVNGYLPRCEEEWVARLKALISDRSLREDLGAAGRQRVEEWFCAEQQAPRLAEVLRRAAGVPAHAGH